MIARNLMEYSSGSGCGCKIPPNHLSTILKSVSAQPDDKRLLVGTSTKDDAAVYDVGSGNAVITSTDFFTPITNNPRSFGKIAAANAISDIYAMGGKPITALAILGWPVDILPLEIADEVIQGALEVCAEVGIVLSGGHSINIPTPIFGLAVTGVIRTNDIKTNDGASDGCKLFLTKPLGIGMLSTAEKIGLLKEEHRGEFFDVACAINSFGRLAGKIKSVKAMTDITGFGLIGHLMEICDGSELVAEIFYDSIPKLSMLPHYIGECTPSGTYRNWDSYHHKVSQLSDEEAEILFDPQTNGGLLIAIESTGVDTLKQAAKQHGVEISEIGHLRIRRDSDTNLSVYVN